MTAIIQQIERQPDPDVVSYIESVLEDAKSGEITGVLILAQDRGGVRYRVAGIDNRFAILGFLAHAMHKLQGDPT